MRNHNRTGISKALKSAFSVITLLLAGGLALSCGGGKNAPPDPQEVAAVSGGVQGRRQPVKVVFTQSQDTEKPLGAAVFTFRPAARGEVSWQDEYTLVFTPSEPLKAGQRYQAEVNLAGVTPFGFDFMTAVPSLQVEVDPVEITGTGDVLVRGRVIVDEGEDIAGLEKAISSPELGVPSWTHENGLHRFVFDPAERLEVSRTVSINWDGKPLGSGDQGFTTVMIPGTDTFQVVDLRGDNGVIEVAFSSTLKPYTDLRGFISLSGNTEVRYSLEGNIVRIYGDSSGGIPVGSELTIQDLEDVEGRRLAVPVQYTVPDKWELPEIRFAGNGVILPTTQGAQLVVETRNVSGLLVEAFQVYGDNMLQFLQINDLEGESELDRVGEPVWTQAFDFPWGAADQNRWVRRGLDVSELSRKYPGGMFRIRVSFRQRHIHYECTAGHGDYSHLTFPDDSFPSYSYYSGMQSSYWDTYTESPDFDWSEWYNRRNDPCHPAFYVSNYYDHNITIGRNVLVSDLGLLAKRTLEGSWFLAATNLISARPSPNTNYRIYNYQGRLLREGKTGPDGIALIPGFPGAGDGSRLAVYAENGLGRAYLKINDSLALAISHFDVAGASPASGLRGLIYGERGVWRPGDDIFLTFLLSDPQGTLPPDHPVSFELEDPRGRIVQTRTYTASVDGFYPMTVSTALDAPTGDWTARVRVGGAVFNRNVKVETVMPNRLKMDLDFGEGEIIKSGPRQVGLAAEWLYGAVAPGLKADVSVSFQDGETAFPGYPDYSFQDPSRTVSSERKTIWEGNLDSQGKTSFNMELNPGTAVPGKVSARFMTRVFEPSGVFSSEQISREYSPYKRYAGLRLPKGDGTERDMLLTDMDHRADIVLLDEDGKPIPGEVALSAAIYKLSWRWWWEKGMDEAAEFASILSRRPIASGTVSAKDGKASWNFRINHPEWGRYLVVVRDGSGGHAAAREVYIDWPGWAGRSQEDGQGGQAMLTLTAGKTSYNAGEKVQVSFPSNKDAAALVAVEKGGEIIKSEWINCVDGTTRYEFPAEPSMVPNVYVHVTLLQPHLQTQNDLPLRLYGIIPVSVEDPRVVLSPRITAPETWEAESAVSFTVGETNGRPMAYTVAVVDEGLLGLTRYTLPNPRNTFYAREASFLKSWDFFHEIIGAYSGKLETLLALGGGDDGQMDAQKETQRFKPVVRFFGPYELKSNEQKTETFDLPPYTGALRIMVLAASSTGEEQTYKAQRAYGTAEASVKVTSDLMVFASLPRVLSPGDEAEVPVYVNSFKEGNRKVRVNLSVPGATMEGQAYQEAAFDRPGEQLLRFRIKAPANPAKLRFTAQAESPGLKTAQHVTDLEVRSTAVPVTRSVYSLVAPGEAYRGNLAYPGREGTNTLTAGFSRLPPINLETRLDFLITYPHGCLEQTTSGVFPQLYLDKIIAVDESRRGEIRANVIAGIERLYGFQVASGGFAYWPGESIPHDWGTSYVGHFLLEARRQGYEVRDQIVRDWLRYQKDRASVWQPRNTTYSYTEQAYRLYTLALAGEADLGSMNRLRDQQNMTLQARWRLAAAYWYAGQRETARNMIRQLDLPQENYRELSATFGSALRDKAMILETMILLGAGTAGQGYTPEEVTRTRSLFEEIAQALSEDTWLSTQETAYALIALAPYTQSNAGTGELTLDYNAAGRSRVVTFTGPGTEEPLGLVPGTETAFTAVNRSSSPVYVKFTARGLPDEGSEPALAEGLALTAEYRDTSGRSVNPGDIQPGEDMEVRVTVRNTYGQAVEEVALIVPVPASWEIVNTRLAGTEALPSSYRYQDIRDDRVMTYFNLNRGEEKTVSFRVNRTYGGTYFRPAIHAYAMYDESIRALIPGVK